MIITFICVGFVGLTINLSDGKNRYNQIFYNVSQAIDDWDYPNGLVQDDIDGFVFKTSRNDPKIIMLGDSHIQQYSPRWLNSTNKEK